MTSRSDFMSKIYLIKTKKEIKQFADELIAENFPMDTILEMSFSQSNQFSFHSSLLIDAIFTKDPALLDPILDKMCSSYDTIKCYSTARTFAKILANIYRLKEQKHATPKMLEITDGRYDEKIIEGCFKHLLAGDCQISVTIWQLQLLIFFMNKKNAWVKDEVIAIIERMRQKDNDRHSVLTYTDKYLAKIKTL